MGGQTIPLTLGGARYELLWVKYLEQHPELVAHAHTLDDFHDAFHTPRQQVCQAESIRRTPHGQAPGSGLDPILRPNADGGPDLGLNAQVYVVQHEPQVEYTLRIWEAELGNTASAKDALKLSSLMANTMTYIDG